MKKNIHDMVELKLEVVDGLKLENINC